MAGREVAKYLQSRGGLVAVVVLLAIVAGTVAATRALGGGSDSAAQGIHAAGLDTATAALEATVTVPLDTGVPTDLSTPIGATITPGQTTITPPPTWTPVPAEACFTPIPLTPVRVDVFPDGGTDYVYDTDGDGVGDTHSLVPPPGFDRNTATDEELQQYGIPPRPTDPEDLARWRDTVGQAHNTSHSLALLPCVSFR